SSFTFVNAGDLTIGTVDGIVGVTTNDGAINIQTLSGNLTVNNDVSAGAATIRLVANGLNRLFSNNAAISNSGGKTITIAADQMALGPSPASSISDVGGGRIILQEGTGGLPINLGTSSDPTGQLNLDSNELNTVSTTGVLQIGIGGAGNV